MSSKRGKVFRILILCFLMDVIENKNIGRRKRRIGCKIILKQMFDLKEKFKSSLTAMGHFINLVITEYYGLKIKVFSINASSIGGVFFQTRGSSTIISFTCCSC